MGVGEEGDGGAGFHNDTSTGVGENKKEFVRF